MTYRLRAVGAGHSRFSFDSLRSVSFAASDFGIVQLLATLETCLRLSYIVKILAKCPKPVETAEHQPESIGIYSREIFFPVL